MNKNNRWMVGWMDGQKKIDDTKKEDWMDIKMDGQMDKKLMDGWIDRKKQMKKKMDG